MKKRDGLPELDNKDHPFLKLLQEDQILIVDLTKSQMDEVVCRLKAGEDIVMIGQDLSECKYHTEVSV